MHFIYKTYINKHFNFKIYKTTTVQMHHREQLPGSEAGFLLLSKGLAILDSFTAN